MNEIEQLELNQEKLTQYLIYLSNDYIKLIRNQKELEERVKKLEFEVNMLNKMFVNHTHRK